MRPHFVRRSLALLFVQACGTELGPPEARLAFSFEQGMEGWAAAAADTGLPGGAYAPWSIQPSTDLAYDGRYALKFSVANYTDAAKIWIVRPFRVTPGSSYAVEVSYAFGTADFGQANLFELLAGTFESAPVDGRSLLAGTLHEPTGNGAGGDVGYQWLRKRFRGSARGNASGLLYVVVGVWGTWEGARTYYVDDLTVSLTPN